MPKIITPASALQESIAIALRRLSDMLGKPIEVTLVARHREDPTAFMIFSEDGCSLEKVVETLQRHMKEQKKLTIGFNKPPANGA